jgi:stage V sporulation protein S
MMMLDEHPMGYTSRTPFTAHPYQTQTSVTPHPQQRHHQDSAPGGTVEVLKVSTKSSPNSVAGALAGVIREQGVVEIQTVGAGALNQAIKAIAIARGFVAPMGLDLICTPSFADIEINGEKRTAIRLLVEPRPPLHP